MQRGFRWEPPEADRRCLRELFGCCLRHGGGGQLVVADAFGHLVFEVELPLLQRLFFQLIVNGDVGAGRQLAQARFALAMLVRPLTELRILIGKNALNVSDTIRHRLSSFESTYPRGASSTPLAIGNRI